MTSIAIASDLHFDPKGILTPPQKVSSLARAMRESHPDAVVLAGDLGHPLANFNACIDLFAHWELPVGVVAGNHDVWKDESYSSQELWVEVLPRMTRIRNCRWLELETILLDDIAIVGSIAWYDYSALESTTKFTASYLQRIKPKISNDARWIDWPWRDRTFAREIRQGLARRLQRLQDDPKVRRVVVVTHVPLFEQQMTSTKSDPSFTVASAYFGNLRTGRVVAQFSKVVAVVSGHLHEQRHAIVHRSKQGMGDIHTMVIGSDYGEPSWILLEL